MITYHKPNGEWGIEGVDLSNLEPKVYGALCKLLDYEKTGLSPDQIASLQYLYEDKCQEVKTLQEKVGTLLRFGRKK